MVLVRLRRSRSRRDRERGRFGSLRGSGWLRAFIFFFVVGARGGGAADSGAGSVYSASDSLELDSGSSSPGGALPGTEYWVLSDLEADFALVLRYGLALH